ncbi:MAG: hypothetical protein P8123_10885 [bacterium]
MKMGMLPSKDIDFEETYHVHSPLKLPDKRRIENLQKIFPLVVEFPGLRKMASLLIRLPLGLLYNQLRRFHKAYCLRFRIFYYRITLREYIQLSWRLIKSKAG